MTVTSAQARMPNWFTKASEVSSSWRPVVVGKSISEISAIGMVTAKVAVLRLQPSLSWNAATMTSRMEISEVRPAKTSEPKNSTPSSAPKGACGNDRREGDKGQADAAGGDLVHGGCRRPPP